MAEKIHHGDLLARARELVSRDNQIKDVNRAVSVHIGLPIVATADRFAHSVANEDEVGDVDRAITIGVTEQSITGNHRGISVHSYLHFCLPSRLLLPVDTPSHKSECPITNRR